VIDYSDVIVPRYCTKCPTLHHRCSTRLSHAAKAGLTMIYGLTDEMLQRLTRVQRVLRFPFVVPILLRLNIPRSGV
jgi:hypothetical protein